MNWHRASFLCAALGVFTLSAAEIALEAEQISDRGAWKVQNGDTFGGAFLIGSKIGAQASGRFSSPKEQKLFLWVRSMTHGGNFRKIQISINGENVGTFGDAKLKSGEKPGWRWEKASDMVDVKKGENSILIKANSHYSRIDRIVLTDDSAYHPGNPPKTVDRRALERKLEGIFPRPKSKAGGVKMLALSGGRPWVGNAFARFLINAGADVTVLNSVYLAGEGGASIKQTPTDKVEPKALDYITPEFERLNTYAIVAVNGIPAANQQRIFTPERIEKLKVFVKNGGYLFVTIHVPETLGDLLPVVPGKTVRSNGLFAERPAGSNFSLLPEKWEIFLDYREASAKNDAKVLSRILNKEGKPVGVYAAIRNYGKGKVLFLNAQYSRHQTARQLFNWAYTPALLTGLTAELSGAKLSPEKTIQEPQRDYPPTTLKQASLDLKPPVLALKDSDSSATVKGKEIIFGNGVRITVGNETLEVRFPGSESPVLRDLRPPEIFYPKKSNAVDSLATAEAVGMNRESRNANFQWKLTGIRGGKTAVLSWESPSGAALEWEFKSGSLNLNGLPFRGFAQRMILKRAPELVSTMKLQFRIGVDGTRLRRFACYQSPRGYKEFDISGAETIDTRSWGFFSAGQPFSWLEGKKGVYSEFTETPFPIDVQYSMEKGAQDVSGNVTFQFGRKKAPLETAWFWQTLGPASAGTTNAWMAMNQFQRKHLRARVGFREMAAMPTATYRNTCTHDEIKQIVKAAGKAGFHFFFLPYCPSPMEQFDSPEFMSSYKLVKDNGMRAYPWTPCCHSPEKTRTVIEHPDWYLKDETGKLYRYFNHFHVADMDNKGFQNWYLGMVDKMIRAGVGTVWYDMAGAASGTVNFATPESRIGFWPQMEIFRFFYDRGASIVTEGMNPLVVDGYIFLKNRYPTYKPGEIFYLHAAQPSGSNYEIDFFRTSMYDTFFPVTLDALVLNFEYVPGEKKMLERILRLLPAVNAALKETGMPFIQETPFGTSWISDTGGALFFFHGVSDFRLTLPEGYEVVSLTGPDGKNISLKNGFPRTVSQESIAVIRKKKK